jgi:hypothetical protein
MTSYANPLERIAKPFEISTGRYTVSCRFGPVECRAVAIDHDNRHNRPHARRRASRWARQAHRAAGPVADGYPDRLVYRTYCGRVADASVHRSLDCSLLEASFPGTSSLRVPRCNCGLEECTQRCWVSLCRLAAQVADVYWMAHRRRTPLLMPASSPATG